MFNDYNEPIQFGQYRGLTIKEVYQGTLNIDKGLLTNYLNKILNETSHDIGIIRESDFIERFELNHGVIKTIGEIHDPDKPLSPSNRIVLGNIQNSLKTYINLHFKDNFIGILQDIRSFSKTQNKPLQIGADPEYLVWCERAVDGFQLSPDCKRKLEKFPIARFRGIHVMYLGQETYEYAPQFAVETFRFNSTNQKEK